MPGPCQARILRGILRCAATRGLFTFSRTQAATTMQRILLFAAYFASPLAPIWALYAFAQGPVTRPVLAPALIAGICSFTWLCWQLVMAARLKHLDRIFGLDAIYRFHVLMGVAALALAGIHTSLMSELPGDSIQADLGGAGGSIVLYVLVFSAVFLTDFLVRRHPPLMKLRNAAAKVLHLGYGLSIWVHNLLLLGLALLLAHALLTPGRGLLPFKAILGAYFCLALGAYLERKVLRPGLALRRRPYVVTGVRPESDSVRTVELAPTQGGGIRHLPGQFLYFRPVSGALPPEEHPFTISSAPHSQGKLTITVKGLGDFTSALDRLRPGDKVAVDGPYGRFCHHHAPRDRDLVFIAGGIGVTPFLSMLESLDAEGFKQRAMLIWSARSRKDLLRFDELQAMAGRRKNFSFHPVLSREPGWRGLSGRLDQDLLRRLLTTSRTPAAGTAKRPREFYICAGHGVMDAVAAALKGLGVPGRRIHAERFGF